MSIEELFNITVDENYYLSPPQETDISSFVEYLNEPEIYKFTIAIPQPYTSQDARRFIKYTQSIEKEYGQAMNWVIREIATDKLIGGIGFHCKYPVGSHREEIGYLLGKPFWGKGIMTRVLKKICDHGFTHLNLIRIEAPIFDFNNASMRVAEKAGFIHEGIARKAYMKDDALVDSVIYAIVKNISR